MGEAKRREDSGVKSPYLDKDPRFTDGEIEQLKKLDDETLRMFRSVFYQDILTEAQSEKLKSVLTVDLVNVLRRFFLTPLEWNEPLFSMANRWSNPAYEGVLCAEVKLAVAGRQKAIKFMERGVARLEDIALNRVSDIPLEVDIRMQKDYANMTNEEAKIETVAMQDSIRFLESALMSLMMYVISPEDKQEIVKRLQKNSAR